MRKSSDHQRRSPTPASLGSRGVSIASGAHIPRIDLEALFRRDANGSSITGAAGGNPMTGVAMTGGGAQMPVAAPSAAPPADGPARPRSRTVALADGTRITFAAAEGAGTLESA